MSFEIGLLVVVIVLVTFFVWLYLILKKRELSKAVSEQAVLREERIGHYRISSS